VAWQSDAIGDETATVHAKYGQSNDNRGVRVGATRDGHALTGRTARAGGSSLNLMFAIESRMVVADC
jgi:hypothetical protein